MSVERRSEWEEGWETSQGESNLQAAAEHIHRTFMSEMAVIVVAVKWQSGFGGWLRLVEKKTIMQMLN